MVTQAVELSRRAPGQWFSIMSSTCRFSASTSIATLVAPRALARAVSVRTRAEPMPPPCRASVTTTPISTVSVPRGPTLSTAMA